MHVRIHIDLHLGEVDGPWEITPKLLARKLRTAAETIMKLKAPLEIGRIGYVRKPYGSTRNPFLIYCSDLHPNSLAPH